MGKQTWVSKKQLIVHSLFIRLILLFTLIFTVAACSDTPSPGSSLSTDPVLIDDEPSMEPVPQVLLRLQQSDELIAPVPTVVLTRSMAATGIQISYTALSQQQLAPAATIEAQWVQMQSCLQQTGVAPLIVVIEEQVMPLTLADDVVRNENPLATEISSQVIASATTLFEPVIQISISDFDGALGSPTFNLRSILGRYLWLSASLPERDYPFDCARQLPTLD